MKKLYTFGLMLVAITAFSVLAVAPASAETTLQAVWQIAGTQIGAAFPLDISGELLLEDTKVPIVGKVAIVCSALLVGTINTEGKGEIELFLTLNEVEVQTELLGEALLCLTQTSCENNATDIEVWPVGLPWPLLAFLMEGATAPILLLVEHSGYEVKCLILGTVEEDTCQSTESDVEFLLANEAAGLTLLGPGAPNGVCSQGGAGSGFTETASQTLLTSTGGALTVASE